MKICRWIRTMRVPLVVHGLEEGAKEFMRGLEMLHLVRPVMPTYKFRFQLSALPNSSRAPAVLSLPLLASRGRLLLSQSPPDLSVPAHHLANRPLPLPLLRFRRLRRTRVWFRCLLPPRQYPLVWLCHRKMLMAFMALPSSCTTIRTQRTSCTSLRRIFVRGLPQPPKKM